MLDKRPTEKCKWCGTPIYDFQGKECEACWAARGQVETNPDAVRKMLAEIHSLGFFKYPKIQSPWKRDRATGAFLQDWSDPTIFALRHATGWRWTEKLDGQNIRILLWPGHAPQVRGRTDRAELRPAIVEAARQAGEKIQATGVFDDAPVLLFGEGIGPKINKGGDLSGGEYRFILFDVFQERSRWWEFNDVQALGREAEVLTAPDFGHGTLLDAADFVRRGFETRLFCAKPGTPAEGLVLRMDPTVYDRWGGRIVTKIKTVDFTKGDVQ